MSTLSLRPAEAEDEDGIANVCLQTADNGQDASANFSRPDLPGLVWSTPYIVHSPQHCFVVETHNRIVGFIVTTTHSREFELWQRTYWWPEVERRLAGFVPTTSHDKEALDTIDFVKTPAPAYADDYPAHLHINLLPEGQGGGFGRRLIETASDKLRQGGVKRLHLGVSFENLNAIGFYKALGFTEIVRTGALILGKDL